MIYLDNAATTQIDPLVVEAMMPYLTEQFGNPGSLYKLGRDAKASVEKARAQVARLIGAKPEQIIFTSGATEANNMVFQITKPFLEQAEKTHVIKGRCQTYRKISAKVSHKRLVWCPLCTPIMRLVTPLMCGLSGNSAKSTMFFSTLTVCKRQVADR